MLNIAVCAEEDSLAYNLPKIATAMHSISGQDHELHTFIGGISLLDHIETEGFFDIILLQADMRGINGIETASELRRRDQSCVVIFFSKNPKYAISAFGVDAMAYLLEPLAPTEVDSVFRKALRTMHRGDNKILLFKTGDGLFSVPRRDIAYAESSGHRLFLHIQGAESLSSYGQLKEIEAMLADDSRFIRVHQSFLVNADYIRFFGSENVEVSLHGKRVDIQVSRSRSQGAREQFISYITKT